MPFDSEVTTKSRDLIVLERARERIARGWCQGALENRDGAMCVLGALNYGLTRRRSGDGGSDYYERRKPFILALGLVPGETAMWNNAPDRIQAEVLARFDAAIERLSR